MGEDAEYHGIDNCAERRKDLALEPVDETRCQADKPNGHSFLTFGGVPGRVRCSERPTHIITEAKEKDGVRGEMSVCPECLAVASAQLGAGYFSIKAIRR